MSSKHKKHGNKRFKQRNSRVMPPQNKKRPTSYADRIAPPETDVKLTYTTMVTLGTGAADESVRYKVNAVRDVDPILGSTAVPGFAEWSSIYNFYRVVKVKYSVQFCNLDLLRSFVCLTYLTNTDPGVTMPRSNVSNPLCKFRQISTQAGMNRCQIGATATLATILGANIVETDPNYSALTSADPADLIWLGVGVSSSPTGPSTSPVTCFIVIDMWTRFYDRKASLAAFLTKTLVDQKKILELEKKVLALHALTQ